MVERRKKTRWRRVVIPVVIVLVIVVAFVTVRQRAMSSAAPEYITHTVARGTVSSTVEASGQVVDRYTYSLSPDAIGTLTYIDGVATSAASSNSGGATSASSSVTDYETDKLYAQVGDRVTKNERIATATGDSSSRSDLSDSLANAQASLGSAQAALSADESSYASVRDDDKATTQSVNAAKKQVSADHSQITTAESTVRKAQNDLDAASVSVRTPVAGVVRSVLTAPHASASTVATIGAGGMRVSVMVSEYDIATIEVDQVVTLTLGSTGTTFSGRVTSLGQVPDDTSGVEQYQVVVSSSALPTPARVGMTVSASIAIASHANVLTVPAATVTTVDGKPAVSVLTDGRSTKITPVTLGLVGTASVEVTSGLTAGEVVVTGADGSVPATTTRRTLFGGGAQ